MPGKAADPPALMTLIVLSGLSVATLNMFLPSLANIAREFQADYALVNLCIAGYAAVSCVTAARDGAVVGSLGQAACDPCRLAAFRLSRIAGLPVGLQRLGVSHLPPDAGGYRPPTPFLLPLFGISHAGSKAASSIGYVAMTSAIAPMLAPMLGGALG